MAKHPLLDQVPDYPRYKGSRIRGFEDLRKEWSAFFGARGPPAPAKADVLVEERLAFVKHFRRSGRLTKFGATSEELVWGLTDDEERARTEEALVAAEGLRVEGRTLEATARATQAIDRDPFYPYGWDVLALAYLQAGEHTLARGALMAWGQIDPAEAIVGERFSAIAFDEGNFDEGFGWIEWALALDPISTDALMARAHARRGLRKQGWKEDLEAARKLNPEDTKNLEESWFNDGSTYPRGRAVRPLRLHWAARLALDGDFERARRMIELAREGPFRGDERMELEMGALAIQVAKRAWKGGEEE